MTQAVVVGAAGRMGRALLECSREPDSRVRIVAGVDRPDSAGTGCDLGELHGLAAAGARLEPDLGAALATSGARLVIDFSDAASTARNLETAARARAAILVGTTGLGPEVEAAAANAALQVPVLVAANTSLGVTLLVELTRLAARLLPQDFDIEIVEAHHRHKKDAPSGTALALGVAAAEGRQVRLADVEAPGRRGMSPRRPGEIGFASVRGGDIVGDHTVLFAGPAERVSLVHQATDRAIFARGALRAGAWLAGQPPGRYQMRDVLALKTAT